jgi:hypothetical protein
VSVTTEALMEALDRILVGAKVERGGALHAKPDDNVPPKEKDSRSKKWGSRPTYQLEALPPNVLAQMVDSEITSLFDREIFEADVAAQPGTRRTIAKQLPAPNGAA